MFNLRFPLIALLCSVGLTGCGDFPTPFKGNPGATAMRLAQPTAPLLVVVASDAAPLPAGGGQALADNVAAALQMEEVPAEAKAPRPGDWRLIARLEARDGGVVPVFTVRNPTGEDKGDTEGSPAPEAAWAAADPALLRQEAAESAPRIAALLTSIRISHDRADPNSLLNRPAKVMVADVKGAPGDGNVMLTKYVRAHIAENGSIIQPTKSGSDFLIQGEVTIVPIPDHKERVEIVWTVNAANGDERGKVAQLNEIPAGMLDHYWGDIAVAVATEAAGGLNDVIARQTGREEAAKDAAAHAPPPAEAKVEQEELLPVPPIPPAPPRPARPHTP